MSKSDPTMTPNVQLVNLNQRSRALEWQPLGTDRNSREITTTDLNS